jgi:hypothetical protein
MQLRKYFVGMEDTSKRMKRSMVHAYVIADKHPRWDFARFKTACKQRSSWLLSGTSTADYVEIFEKIFNAGRVPSKRINLVEFFKTKEYQDK